MNENQHEQGKTGDDLAGENTKSFVNELPKMIDRLLERARRNGLERAARTQVERAHLFK